MSHVGVLARDGRDVDGWYTRRPGSVARRGARHARAVVTFVAPPAATASLWSGRPAPGTSTPRMRGRVRRRDWRAPRLPFVVDFDLRTLGIRVY
jgi:hypothetical protein